jgi:TusA-related sulfurtransferase
MHQALPLVIEAKAGEKRRGHWKDYAYGYIEGTLGTDGDEVDVYVGVCYDAPNVFVVDQMRPPDFVELDEQKCFVYFQTAQQVKEAYWAMYDDDHRRLGTVRTIPMDDFIAQLNENPGQVIKALWDIPKNATLEVIIDEESMSKNLKEAIQLLNGVTDVAKSLATEQEEVLEKALTAQNVPRELRGPAPRNESPPAYFPWETPVVRAHQIANGPARSTDPRNAGTAYKSCDGCGTMHKSLGECPKCTYLQANKPKYGSAIDS